MTDLFAQINTRIRFNEVDSMGIVWHGSYIKYFEDAREEFGRKFELGYLKIFSEGFYAPLVNIDFSFKSPLKYGDIARIEIKYNDNEAAKIEFSYKIYNSETDILIATGASTQVFLDKDFKLMLYPPDFFIQWKNKYLNESK
ncbi:acyl-CoA thioesterase [Odoribacter sp. OttesenSCG-928-L07]|nr:acyl-CoA thioesterase [Odoribacter sp. OttesenSCG-928-L07]MDL2238908.1 acyl-CoA thioesterase [Bacteroidales bacterium OttesenSCG-928-L14]